VMISYLFDGVRMINSVADGNEKIGGEDLKKLKEVYGTMVFDILGLRRPDQAAADTGLTGELIETLLELRRQARDNKDFATSDRIRNRLSELGITIKDTKDGTDWTL